MVKFLALQIKLGKITLADVPEKWRKAVEEEVNRE
jgi:hypothetical protein